MSKRAFVKLVICLFFVCAYNVSAQEGDKEKLTVKIDQIISKDFPNMTVYAVVENKKGELMTGLSPGLFQFRIDYMDADVKSSIIPFTMKEAPIDYSIILSNNGIMEGEPLDFQKNALLQFVDTMNPNDTLSLYTIGEEAGAVFEETSKAAIDVSRINAIEISQAQPRVYDSIITVMRKVQRRTTERRVVIVISDGRDQNSRFTKEQLLSVLSEVELPIYALGIRVLGTQSLSSINEMSDVTGGSYIYTPSLSNIPEGIKNLKEKITKPYVIKLKVRNIKADNLPHVLETSVIERDSEGRGQKAFTAVKVPVPQWMRVLMLALIIIFIIVIAVLFILARIKKRKSMGITGRRCTECNSRLKDSWDTCPFCRYLSNTKKKKKKGNKKGE